MCGGITRIDGDRLPEGLNGLVYFALSGKLFAFETMAGDLAAPVSPFDSPLSFLCLPAAFSSVHPILFPCDLLALKP
jgi:hypothetical protein